MDISEEVVRWLVEATSNPEDHKLGDWVLLKQEPQDMLGMLKPGGFGVTLQVEKHLNLNKTDVPLLGQVKFYFDRRNNRFAAEAEATNLSDLNSRLIPKLYGLGMTPGSHRMPYVIMERIEGFDLSSDEFKPLSATDFRTLAIDTLRALKYAKEKGLSHTDIKPANIMYSKFDDTYVIVDFGIARLLKRNEVEGPVGGTPGYRAPESFLDVTSHKSDIYSLGLTFYYALSKKEPVLDALTKHWARKGVQRQEDRILRDAEYQELLEELEFDFSIFEADQAALLEGMLEKDLSKRFEVKELLGLAQQLKVGLSVFDSEANDPWGQLQKTIKNNLDENGLVNFKMAVREAKHGGLWLKLVDEANSLNLVCSRPKNPIALSQLGWTNRSAGTMKFELEPSLDSFNVAQRISQALEIGFAIERPWTVTFG
jgi:serine/threonine protein kinase